MDICINELGQPIGFPLPNWVFPPLPERKRLDGDYCFLEPLDPLKHARDLFAFNSFDRHGENWTYLPYGPFGNLDAYTKWINDYCLHTDPVFYAIVDKLDSKAVGIASYLRIMPASGSIEVGHINYSPRLQRTIAATEAMFIMMQYAFKLGYRRYEWKCDALNKPSRTAAQRLGFSFEGIFRYATVYKERNRDTAWYSVIDKDWPELRTKFQMWLAHSNFDSANRQIVSLSALTRPMLRAAG